MKSIIKKITVLFLTLMMVLSTVMSNTWILDVKANEASETSSARTTINSFTTIASQEVFLAEKGTAEDVQKELPEYLEAHTEENEIVNLPVTWECEGDYEGTNYFYYQFTPKWDESQYDVNEGVTVPYIWVCLYERSNITRAVTSSSNETVIYNFLINELGCNMATAVGILANIERESSFRPEASVIDTNGLTSYGICQWNGSRFESLKNYCSNNGYLYSTLEGQLNYLKYELSTTEKSAWNKMQGIENTANGAYTAGYYWAQYFERCAEVYREVSATRARDVYWPDYSGETGEILAQPTISGYNTPSVLTVGNAFSIRGVVSSAQIITNVTVGCYNADGEVQISVSANPNLKSYNIHNLDNDFEFNKLNPGIYYYRISATVAGNTVALVNSVFTILAKGETIPSGTYVIAPYYDDTYAVGTATDSNASGVNIELKRRGNSDYQKFVVNHLGNGYYSIKIAGTGRVLDVENSSTTSESNVQQSLDSGISSQRWQILPAGESYCLVPQNATNLCLGVAGKSCYEGANIAVFTPNLLDTQRFSVEMYDANWKPVVNPFTDVKKGQYYYNPVLWAVENGITDGWTDTTFAPDMGCTRGQVVTFLWRAAGEPKAATSTCKFTDVAVDAYYREAVLWAVENGITDGWTDTLFAPDMGCTRGQIVTFIWRAASEPNAVSDRCDFTDVAGNAYYREAVLWAVENGITDGWTNTLFAPDMECTRGQVVTFLYRYYEQ